MISWRLVFYSQDVKQSASHKILMSVTQGPMISFLLVILVALRQYVQTITEVTVSPLFYTTND